MPPEKITETLDQARCPENATCLIPASINPEMFRHMPKYLKDADTGLRYIRNAIYKAGGPAATVWAQLIEAESALTEEQK